MQLNHDAEAMGKLLDDDFVFTDYDGTVMSKPQFLDPFATNPTSSLWRHQIT